MCGVAAIVGQRDIPASAVPNMVSALRHRGPDSSCVCETELCQLGHARLEIIDPAGGAQPMWDDTQRFCISFNGEVYNYRELRRELEKRGVSFRTNSDTEVLLLGFREFGEAIVQRLNGQFAFAIWDKHERCLFAARDRMGEKPLYWSKSRQQHLVLASEIKGILASDLIEPTVDRVSVDAFLALIYVPPGRTIYENVQPVPPGHTLTWRNGRVDVRRYWQPTLSNHPMNAAEAAARTRELLEQAVERQMVADTPVGAFLSGGFDSATIVAMMSKHASQPVRTFSAGFGDLINELPFAKAVAKHYQTDHSEMQVDINVGEMLQRMSDVYDEPFADSSNIPTYLISEFARRNVKVVLSGDGGDELFGGYTWYLPMIADAQLPKSLAAMTMNFLSAKMASRLWKFGIGSKQQKDEAKFRYHGIRNKRQFPDPWRRHLAQLSIQSRKRRNSLWQCHDAFADDWLEERYLPHAHLSGIDRVVDFDVRCYLPGDILVKVDRAAMAHGLETRSPFLDADLVEFILGLPAAVRFDTSSVDEHSLKGLLRESCGDLWPAQIRNRKKQGFGAPIGSWMQRPDVVSLVERVFQTGSDLCDLLPGVATHKNRILRSPQVAWSLLCLGLWLEQQPAKRQCLPLAS